MIRIYQIDVQENQLTYPPLKVIPCNKVIKSEKLDNYRKKLQKRYSKQLKREVTILLRTIDSKSSDSEIKFHPSK